MVEILHKGGLDAAAAFQGLARLQSWGEGGVRGSGLRAWPSLREQVAEVDRTPAILHFTGRSYAHATYSLPVMILERPDYNLKVIQWLYSQSS